MERPAMPVGPIHHRGDRKAPRGQRRRHRSHMAFSRRHRQCPMGPDETASSRRRRASCVQTIDPRSRIRHQIVEQAIKQAVRTPARGRRDRGDVRRGHRNVRWAQPRGIDLDREVRPRSEAQALEQLAEGGSPAGGDVERAARGKRRGGAEERQIRVDHVVDVQEIAGGVEVADQQPRRREAGLRPCDLPRPGWQDETLVLSRSGMIERTGDDQRAPGGRRSARMRSPASFETA